MLRLRLQLRFRLLVAARALLELGAQRPQPDLRGRAPLHRVLAGRVRRLLLPLGGSAEMAAVQVRLVRLCWRVRRGRGRRRSYGGRVPPAASLRRRVVRRRGRRDQQLTTKRIVELVGHGLELAKRLTGQQQRVS